MDKTTLKAAAILAVMFALMFFSAWNDSAIMDELAHIPAGYSYVAEKDMRLNPEHPPFIKDLAGIPLLFLDLNFPTDVKAWTHDLNGQWDMGRIFLYDSGNNPDQILHWSRFPMMLLAVLFGWLLFLWTRWRFGPRVALLTLFLFALSPTFIAHSRYVTTDLAAAFGFFIGITAFINVIENPSRKNILVAGLALGVAQLLKFSLFLLAPIYGIAGILWVIALAYTSKKRLTSVERIKYGLWQGLILLGRLVIICLIAIVLIWIVYAWHVWNYPLERQLADATQNLSTFGMRWLVNIDLWLIQNEFTRPLGQYMLGLLMVIQRAAGGNTTYFLGEITNTGWWYYFPIAYLLKEHLALHILTGIALFTGVRMWLKHRSLKVLNWIRDHFAETTMLVLIAVYWSYSIRSTLNIGVRHVLPTFPFMYLLVAKQITAWLSEVKEPDPQSMAAALKQIYQTYASSLPKRLIVGFLLFWIGALTLLQFPHYLSYYNELAGGSKNGYVYIVDSNYDWGQDLKRLAAYVEENNIDHLSIEYFGGGSLDYYLPGKAEPWWSRRGPASGYFAISATLREGAFGVPAPFFKHEPVDSYPWLRGHTPIGRAGESIFIYKLP